MVTTTSSLGMWAPVFNDEWEGDVYLGAGDKSKETETTTGKVVFKGELLPWQPGMYEVRIELSAFEGIFSNSF